MPMSRILIVLTLVVAGSTTAGSSLRAQNILQDTLRDFRLGDAWIYDDWDAARALAEKNGKPIFAVFRCVP